MALNRLRNLPPRVPTHSPQIAERLPKYVDPFYGSGAWRKLVTELIMRRGRFCEACGKAREDGGFPVRLIGDHIVERRDGGAELDPANVRLLCAAAGGNGKPHADGTRGGCHPRKTAREALARAARGPKPGVAQK